MEHLFDAIGVMSIAWILFSGFTKSQETIRKVRDWDSVTEHNRHERLGR